MLYCILILIPETGKKKDSLLPDAIDVADNLQCWPDRPGGTAALRFSHIAALHSELVAVSTTGQLYQWRWADKEPYLHPEVKHPTYYFLWNLMTLESRLCIK